MESELDRFWKAAAPTLSFTYQSGAVTAIEAGHHVEWRRMPTLALSYIEGYEAVLELDGGQVVRIRDGEAICVRPWVRHRLAAERVRRGVSRWSHTAFTIFGGVDALAFFDTPWVIRGERARQIGVVNERLASVAESPASSVAGFLRRDSLGLELLALTIESSVARGAGQLVSCDMDRLAEALQYMSAHMAETIYHAQLASICGVSASRFHSLFKEVVGMSPGRYLQDLRLRKAQALLLGGDPPVKSVAAQVGYPDEFHFSRLFRKRFGRSPSEFRRMARGFRM